jgi:proline racemase
MKKFSTIDSHVAGEAIRLLVDGAPSVSGRTMQDKLAWMRRHSDALRRWLMLEPRGHSGMHGALLTEPVAASPTGAHAGLLFMHAAGFPAFSGESVIAAATIAIENRLIHVDSDELLLDTPSGLVRARPRYVNDRIDSVTVTGVPSFVLSAGVPVQLGTRVVRLDIAFGGEFYAIVDSESMGVSIDAAHATQLVRAALDIRNAMKASREIQGTIFTGPARGAADLRSATVLYGEQGGTADPGVLKRSPGLAGTCALMAVLDAMGLLADDQPFTHEGVLGTMLQGRVLRRDASNNDEPALVIPMVEASAWVTGRHEFQVDDNDRLDPFEI